MEPVSFPTRLWMSLTMPWRVLFDASFAQRLRSMGEQAPALPPAGESKPPAAEVALTERDLTPALQLLAILQREGRFVDFLQEDAASFSDEEIGGAARVVHEGCNRGLRECLALVPVREESEGAAVTLPEGFDAVRNRVTGNVGGDPPYRGTLAHHGWRVAKLELPERSVGGDPHVIAPAEIEV